jgi:hypothetical protein
MEKIRLLETFSGLNNLQYMAPGKVVSAHIPVADQDGKVYEIVKKIATQEPMGIFSCPSASHHKRKHR